MAIPGIFNSNHAALGDNILTVAARVLRITDSGETPMMGMMAGVPHESPESLHYMWYEDESPIQTGNIVNNAATGSTLIFDDSSYMLSASLCWIPSTGEFVYIDTIDQATRTASVFRGVGEGTVITAVDGTATPVAIHRIAGAFEQESQRPDNLAEIPTPKTQHIQTFRNGYGVANVYKHIRQHTTSDRIAKSRQQCAYFQRQEIEMSMLWGVKDTLMRNGKLLLLAGGLKSQIKTNVYTENVSTTWNGFASLTETLFANNIAGQPNERVGMGGYGFLQWVNDIADLKSYKILGTSQSTYGWNISTIITREGHKLKYLTHPMFLRTPERRNEAVFFHPGSLSLLKFRDAEHEGPESIGTAGVDATSGILSSDCALVVRAEKCSMYINKIENATL